jgi:predicted CoA-substrate-specific enzyme activase
LYTLGLDIGSTTTKCAVVSNGEKLVSHALVKMGIGGDGCGQALKEALEAAGVPRGEIAAFAVTGYGRLTYKDADIAVSELTCHAAGARFEFPNARTVIDIGGQDAKVIALGPDGRMQSFVMNDKCAAGTGRFLEGMAAVLNMPVGRLESAALAATAPEKISSTCAVFAESEVIGRLSLGAAVPDIAAGVCESVASRVSGLAKRLYLAPDICMSGGVANNGAVRQALSIALGLPVLYSEHAQLFGAIGAALVAFEREQRKNREAGEAHG